MKSGIVKLKDNYGNKYILKEKPYYLTQREYEMSLFISQQLLENQMFTPKIIKAPSGYTINVNHQRYALQEYIEPDPTAYPLFHDQMSEIGVIAADLYKKSKYINMQKRKDIPKCRSIHLLDVDSRSMQQAVKILKQYVSGDNLKYVIQTESLIQTKVIDKANLPFSWVHGDLHIYNTISHRKGMYVIDFDDIHWNYRIVDLIWPCIIHGVWNWYKYDDSPSLKQQFDKHIINHIISSYVNITDLTDVERGIFPQIFYALLIKSFICIEGLVRNSRKQTNEIVTGKLKDLLALSESIDFEVISFAK